MSTIFFVDIRLKASSLAFWPSVFSFDDRSVEQVVDLTEKWGCYALPLGSHLSASMQLCHTFTFIFIFIYLFFLMTTQWWQPVAVFWSFFVSLWDFLMSFFPMKNTDFSHAGLDAVLPLWFLLVIMAVFLIRCDAYPCQRESCMHMGEADWVFQSPADAWRKTPNLD